MSKTTFKKQDLSEKQVEDFEFVLKRINQLQDVRKTHYGTNLDNLYADADRDYIPHRLGTKGKKVVATDEEKGWRGALVQLGSSNWQSDLSQSNPFVKIQAALSILIDQNPSGVFTPLAKKFQQTTTLMKQLYERSWEVAQSKAQLKLFVFNLSKYGWACARTYPLRITRKVKVLVDYDEENPENSKYESKEIVEYNDIMRENLDPRNVWIDDMTKPNNPFSIRDWCWRKVYALDAAEEEFGKHKNWKKYDIKPGGNTAETISEKKSDKEKKEENLIEVYFYENRLKDLFMVIAGGVPIIIEPLPISDSTGLKKLSLWQAYWNLRHAESPYGIGIYEAIRYDQAFLDRVRNMTVDQLTLSIYKMFFYQGTQALTDTGDIVIKPGAGRQVLDPKNINWINVPGPGADAYKGIEMFKADLDEASGITDPLLGKITGKTAFEISQAKEAALKRLRGPLDNILDALNQEGYITISLIQLLYSIPETIKITDPQLITDYLGEIEGDQELYERDDEGNFTAKLFKEFPLNLDKDEKGNLIETEESRFFRVKPRFLKWEGVINIKAQSILSSSKQIDKALDLEMYNILIPVLGNIAQERIVLTQSGQDTALDNLTYGKAAKNIAKLYDKDPRDIFPDTWLAEQAPQKQPLFVPAEQEAPQQIQGGAEKVVPNVGIAERPQGVAQKIISRLSSPFKRV